MSTLSIDSDTFEDIRQGFDAVMQNTLKNMINKKAEKQTFH